MKSYRCYDIDWDTDMTKTPDHLPDEIVLTVEDGFDIETEGANAISDIHHYSVFGFCWEAQ